MSFRVELTAGVYADLDRLMAWLAERSSSAAAGRFSARFSEALDRVEARPLTCGLAYEAREFPTEVRHFLFKVGPTVADGATVEVGAGIVARFGRIARGHLRSIDFGLLD